MTRKRSQLGIGMCNSDRVLKYLAVTAMIDHENDDLEKIQRLVRAVLWVAHCTLIV